jgi:6-phosphofructokinase
MADIRCIGIGTGGGDAPGLNAVIRAATKAAIIKYGWKVIGIPDGFDGLIWPEKAIELTLKEVSGILPRGGPFSAPPTAVIPSTTRRSRTAKKCLATFPPR